MTSSAIVQKLWNYCNILRDDLSACGHVQAGGLSYLLALGLSASPAQASAQASGDYPSAWSILSPSATLRIDSAQGLRTGSERWTFLLFPKTADEQTWSAWKTFPKGAE